MKWSYLCYQRRQLKQQKYTSTEAGLEYRKVNREVRMKMKVAKKEWTEEQCKNIEKGMMSGNTKEAYNTLKVLTKTKQKKSAVIEDSRGGGRGEERERERGGSEKERESEREKEREGEKERERVCERERERERGRKRERV